MAVCTASTQNLLSPLGLPLSVLLHKSPVAMVAVVESLGSAVASSHCSSTHAESAGPGADGGTAFVTKPLKERTAQIPQLIRFVAIPFLSFVLPSYTPSVFPSYLSFIFFCLFFSSSYFSLPFFSLSFSLSAIHEVILSIFLCSIPPFPPSFYRPLSYSFCTFVRSFFVFFLSFSFACYHFFSFFLFHWKSKLLFCLTLCSVAK